MPVLKDAIKKAVKSGYLKPAIKIEFGARGEHWPAENKKITSFVSEIISDAMDVSSLEVQVLSPRRTFWEKATILHSHFYLPENKDVPIRHSRHYYDVFFLLKSPHRAELLKDAELLEKVAEHKKLFFRSASSQYDLAKKGTLRMSPNDRVNKAMEQDYKAMQEMLFGEIPTWAEILEEIEKFEKEFNRI